MFNALHTERLLLRPLASSDSAFILDLLNSKGWIEFIGDRNVHTIHDAEEYIDQIIKNPKVHYLVFEEKNSEEAMGILTYIQRDELPSPDFGFAILPKFEGMGFTQEASRTCLHELFRLENPGKILAITTAQNSASKNLLGKLGFRLTGLHESKGEFLELYQLSA